MSGEIGRLINRNGRYFARLVVPADLRSQIGKSELRAGLGADRRTALRKLPLAAAGLQDVIADARRKTKPGPTVVRFPISLADVAHRFYDRARTR
jgi:hypothetical protein